MPGTVIQINVSPGGLPKRPISLGRIGAAGVEGDAQAHTGIHGGPGKAVLLIAAEVVDELAARGYPVFYGALGENLTARGIDVRSLRIGDRLRAGSATIEIAQVRAPCRQLDVYGKSLQGELHDARVKAGDSGSPRWGRSGFYASVVEAGVVAPGDIIAPVAR
jgi:MOSC domain-containing protein YiiM